MYILDAEPKKAANSLTKRNIMSYIKDIEETFIIYNKYRKIFSKDTSREINRELRHKVLRKFIQDKKCRSWLVTFYDELQEIYKKYISLDNTYLNNDNFDKSILEEFKTYNTILLANEDIPEFSVIKAHTYKYSSQINICEDKIQLNRILYILRKFREDQFPKGFPQWYLLGEKETVFKSYNFKNRVSVKIELVAGNYRYFHRIMKGEWKEIKDVPDDMAFIINSFLFPL